MGRIEKRIFEQERGAAEQDKGRGRLAFFGDVNLDSPRTLEALNAALRDYESDLPKCPPLAIIIMGHFVKDPVMAGNHSGDCIEYKESFNSLASILSDLPKLLSSTTFIFVPSDHDAWASTFSAGASTIIPRKPVPELFTSRIKRAFATANADAEKASGQKVGGEAIWTTNPSRLSIFGPAQEIVLFRDDMIDRLRRNAIHFPFPQEEDTVEDVDGGGIPLRSRNSTATTATTSGSKTQTSQTTISSNPLFHPAGSSHESMEVDSPTPPNGATAEGVHQITQGKDPDSDSNLGPRLGKDIQKENDRTAYALVKTILDQGYLSPFPLSTRPVLWDYASSLQLYPLPTVLVLVDPEAPPLLCGMKGVSS